VADAVIEASLPATLMSTYAELLSLKLEKLLPGTSYQDCAV